MSPSSGGSTLSRRWSVPRTVKLYTSVSLAEGKFRDPTVRDAEDLQDLLPQPLLAQIPLVRGAGSRRS